MQPVSLPAADLYPRGPAGTALEDGQRCPPEARRCKNLAQVGRAGISGLPGSGRHGAARIMAACMLGGRTPDAAHPHPSRACRPGVTAAGELDLRQTGNLMRFTIAVNFCGLPAVSVPVGHSSQGAPRLLPGYAPAHPRMRPASPRVHPGSCQGAPRLLPGRAPARDALGRRACGASVTAHRMRDFGPLRRMRIPRSTVHSRVSACCRHTTAGAAGAHSVLDGAGVQPWARMHSPVFYLPVNTRMPCADCRAMACVQGCPSGCS